MSGAVLDQRSRALEYKRVSWLKWTTGGMAHVSGPKPGQLFPWTRSALLGQNLLCHLDASAGSCPRPPFQGAVRSVGLLDPQGAV